MKRIFLCLLALVFVLGMSIVGGCSNQQPTPSEAPATEAPAAEEPAAEEPATEQPAAEAPADGAIT